MSFSLLKSKSRSELSPDQSMGLLFAVYMLFGLTPLYWKLLSGVSALEMVCHRSLWGSMIIATVMLARGEFPLFFQALHSRKDLFFMTLCSLAHLWNWWIYIWAVTNGKVLECSLGQFITPMVCTLLGIVFFRERASHAQWIGMTFALAGLVILFFCHGSLPWVSVQVSVSAALFAFFRKQAPVAPAPGMLMELIFSAPFLWTWLVFAELSGSGHFLGSGFSMVMLLIGCGFVSAVPQLGLAAGLRRVPMISIGIIQYIQPTTVFLVGILLMREQVSMTRLVVFLFIWTGIAISFLERLAIIRKHGKPGNAGRRDHQE